MKQEVFPHFLFFLSYLNCTLNIVPFNNLCPRKSCARWRLIEVDAAHGRQNRAVRPAARADAPNRLGGACGFGSPRAMTAGCHWYCRARSGSGRGAVVVLEQSAEPLAAFRLARRERAETRRV